MARVVTKQKQPPTKIDKFFGLHQDIDGETNIKLGYSPNMLNFRITSNYKLKKRAGQTNVFTFTDLNSPVRAMWQGKINGVEYFLFVANGSVYKGNLTDNTYTSIGTLVDGLTTFFYYNSKIYIMNGHEYYSYDGTIFKVVEGYIPETVSNLSPTLQNGISIDGRNALTNYVIHSYSGDATTKIFKLMSNVIEISEIEVDAEVLATNQYTVDIINKKVTFVDAPSALPNNIKITVKLEDKGHRQEIVKNKYFMFYGGQNDTRIHVWGNEDYPNRRSYSGLENPEYFPVDNYTDVGTNQYAITDIVLHYDRQIIFTNGGQSFYTTSSLVKDINGIERPSYTVLPLNDAIGNVAPNQVQVIQNSPISIQNQLYNWTSSNVRDERNANTISKLIQPSLDQVDLTKAITFDYQEKSEYWLCVGEKAWIWNYSNNTWYMYDNVPATCFLVIERGLYFGTSDGRIVKFDEEKRNDNGNSINCIWEMAFFDFNRETYYKYMRSAWLSIQPASRTSAVITWHTNSETNTEEEKVNYNLATFKHVNFKHFSFNTNYNPQPQYIELQTDEFIYFKTVIENNSTDETLTVLSLNLQSRLGAENMG